LGRRVQIRELDPDITKTLQVTSDKKYLWDGLEITEERDTTGAVVQRRFYNQGFVDSDGTTLFYTRDQLGSIRELTDSSQAVRARYDYDSWGRMTKLQGDRDTIFGYTGVLWHAPSGLGLTVFRAYDPNLGRWINRDPVEEAGGINLYEYVLNNPILFNDFLGLCPCPSQGGLPTTAPTPTTPDPPPAYTHFKDMYDKAKTWSDRWNTYKACLKAVNSIPASPTDGIPTDPQTDEDAAKACRASRDRVKNALPSVLDCLQGLWSSMF
jgi:RHS repeat-associated protein